ncbi:hypothetical protein R1sor_016212 [Riccia sorocarpa]|uniref:Reverse transcriptase zinc-binding domain-containing protein n=1 Tax=Riccia sorocarpa TaxID=122646 RepID=A0ABD3HES3_9MARC
MVAWDNFLKTYQEGGIGLTPFGVQGKALRLRQLLRIFLEDTEDWKGAFEAIVQQAMATRVGGSERRNWKIEELLLSTYPQRLRGAQTASGFLSIWHEARNKLKLDEETKKKKINTIGKWLDWTCFHEDSRPLPRPAQLTEDHGREMLVESKSISQLKWKWQVGRKEVQSWNLTTRTCKRLLTGRSWNCERLNSKWGTQDSSRRWAKRFTAVWKSSLPPRRKAWIWKILQNGLPTLVRALKWNEQGSRRCARCNEGEENTTHLFFTCREAREKWSDLRFLAEGLPCAIQRSDNLLTTIDSCFRRKNPSSYFLLTVTMSIIWRERNRKTYEGTNMVIPTREILNQTQLELKAMAKGIDPESRKGRRLAAVFS